MKHRLLVIILMLALFAASLQAAYLTNMPLTLSQPDGSKLECFASGDEYHNWLHDGKNYTIIPDPKTGYYCYAELSGGKVQASRLIVGRDLPVHLEPGVNISIEEYKAARAEKFLMPQGRNAPTTGTINNLVIFIRFAGEAEFNQNISLYEGWFNSNASSQKNYFLEASYNQLTVNTHFYPVPANSYVVSWQDSHPRSYFQPYNASSNPNGYNGETQHRTREFTLLQNACNALDAVIPSSLVVDSDGDGRVDNVVFIISGGADGWAELLWPHRWSLYDRYVYINGKRVYDFNLQLRDFLSSQNVGVICHEFFHTLGAPDLYHYTGNGIDPAGRWDLMQSNTNPPQHMGAYMKQKYGGWLTIPTISADQLYTLNPLTMQQGSAYRINSSDPNQYFVLEYRRKTGTFENSLPGSGLLAYRIDTRYNGNADGPPDEVYIYRPGGSPTANGTLNNACFSMESGRTMLNSSTDPYPFMQNGSMGPLSIFEVGSAGATISFNKGMMPVVEWDLTSAAYQESYETFFPPRGWMNAAISGTKTFEQLSSGTSPTCSPYQGTAMLRYNSYSASSGSSAMLVTPILQAPDTGDLNYTVSFAMYRDTGYSTRADRIELYLSGSPNLSGSPLLIGTVNRCTALSPQVISNGWYSYSFNLPISANSSKYLIFKAVSGYGNNMYFDDFVLSSSLKLPFSESFDSCVTPNLPPTFSVLKVPSSSSAYVRSYSSQSFSAPNCVQLYNSGDASVDLRLVSAPIKGGLNKLRLKFQARGSTSGQTLIIGTQSSPSSVFTPLQSITLSTVYSQIDLNLSSYSGSNTYLAFQHGLGGTSRNIYLDDLEIFTLPVRDLELKKLSAPSYAENADNVRFDIEVLNSSQNTMSQYTLKLIDVDSSTVLSQSIFASALAPGEITVNSLLCDFPASGSYRIVAQVQHNSDSVSANNCSPVHAIQIFSPEAEIQQVDDPETSSTANTLPFNFYWKNNVAESIYTAEELFFPNGQISGIIYHYDFLQELQAKPLKVWMKNTTAQNLSTGWLDSADYTLVFDSTVNLESGVGSLYLHFIQPFVYSGGELAIRTNRPLDTAYFNSANYFLQYTDLTRPNRSRYIQSDTTVHDPLAPSGAGTLANMLPQISFVFEDIILEAVSAQISLDISGNYLSWDAVPGARSYQIWHSTDLQDWELWGWQEGCSIELGTADKAFFKIVASSGDPD